MELFDFLYNENDDALDERVEFLKNAIESIFKIEDKDVTAPVIQTMWLMAAYVIGGIRKIPIEIVESVMRDQMPDYLENVIKSNLYAGCIALAYIELKRYNEALHKCDIAIDLDQNNIGAWHNKG